MPKVKALRTPAQITALARTHKFPIPYKPTLHTFKGSNLTFNPATGSATSYVWYYLARRINGILLLNTYPYSPTTCRHYTRLRQLLRQLRLRFTEIEAPLGLQDLDYALHHTYTLWATTVIANQHARKPLPRTERAYLRTIARLKSLGATQEHPPQHYLDKALAKRAERLSNDRAKREAKREAALIASRIASASNAKELTHA